MDSKHDVTLLTQQLDTTRHELEAVRTALARTNDIAGTTLASVRSDHVSEVHMLSAQLEETMSAYNRSVAEAEHMMSAKEGILHKYKTEARGAAAKLHACQVRWVVLSAPGCHTTDMNFSDQHLSALQFVKSVWQTSAESRVIVQCIILLMAVVPPYHDTQWLEIGPVVCRSQSRKKICSSPR